MPIMMKGMMRTMMRIMLCRGLRGQGYVQLAIVYMKYPRLKSAFVYIEGKKRKRNRRICAEEMMLIDIRITYDLYCG